MCIRRFTQLLALPFCFVFLTGFAAAQGDSPLKLDIVGIMPGMPARQAVQAMKADNPRLALTSATYKYEGFNDPLVATVAGNDAPATINESVHRASEHVQILLTMPPNHEEVWGVTRSFSFPMAERPSMQTVVDALRKKYGPETVSPRPLNYQSFVWIYDAQGRPLGPRGVQLNRVCAGTLAIYAGDAKTAINADIASPRAWPPECTSIIVVNANIQGVPIADNQLAASAMDVTLFDGGRYRTALAATRAAILNAVHAREQKQVDDANKHPAPKL